MTNDLTTHIYAVKNLISRGPSSDDMDYSNRFIAHLIKINRNLLMRRKADKFQSMSPFSYQSLCVDLERASYTECTTLNLPADCMLLRSTIEIPNILGAGRRTLGRITYVDGRPISHISPQAMAWNKYRENQVNSDRYFIHNKRLYILPANKYLKKVFVYAIFEDPEEIANIESTCISPGDKVDFTIDAELIPPLYELVLQQLAATKALPRDDENNAKDTENSQQDNLN